MIIMCQDMGLLPCNYTLFLSISLLFCYNWVMDFDNVDLKSIEFQIMLEC